MINLKELLKQFIKHVEGMTDEEILLSIEQAENLTKDCDDYDDNEWSCGGCE